MVLEIVVMMRHGEDKGPDAGLAATDVVIIDAGLAWTIHPLTISPARAIRMRFRRTPKRRLHLSLKSIVVGALRCGNRRPALFVFR